MELHDFMRKRLSTALLSRAAFVVLDIDIFCRQYSLPSDRWCDAGSADLHAVLTQSWSHNKCHWEQFILMAYEQMVQEQIFKKMLYPLSKLSMLLQV